jgi:hypothetical protein
VIRRCLVSWLLTIGLGLSVLLGLMAAAAPVELGQSPPVYIPFHVPGHCRPHYLLCR